MRCATGTSSMDFDRRLVKHVATSVARTWATNLPLKGADVSSSLALLMAIVPASNA